jgi:hypothetical protein
MAQNNLKVKHLREEHALDIRLLVRNSLLDLIGEKRLQGFSSLSARLLLFAFSSPVDPRRTN